MNAVIGLLLALATTTPPAGVERTAVFLQCDAQDAVGATYVARLRETLEASSTYRLARSPMNAKFLVSVVTMDPKDAELGTGAGESTVAAVTLQLENPKGLNHFVYSWVLVANRDKVDSLATDLFGAIDREIRQLEGSVQRLPAHVQKVPR